MIFIMSESSPEVEAREGDPVLMEDSMFILEQDGEPEQQLD